MSETTVTVSRDSKPTLVALLRRLPAILSGSVPDVYSIAQGFKLRLGYTFISLVAPNFEELGRGQAGADGDKWAPLSRAYLAYGRRFGPGEMQTLKKAAGLGRGHKHGVGPHNGLLTRDQILLWKQIFGTRLGWLVKRMPIEQAKQRAAQLAWAAVKKAGGKTKLDVYGNRKVQILVDTGRLRQSLQPGQLSEAASGPGAEYNKPNGAGGTNQELETSLAGCIVVGTNDEKAKYHHHGKGKRRRRLWPSQFPTDWWNQILGAGIAGLVRIAELYNGGGKPL
jgi:hypothetical protein